MPSTLTHYIFNKGLVSDLKYEDIFLLGGQGADVFFFYGYNFVKRENVKEIRRIGEKIHQINPDVLYHKMLSYAHNQSKENKDLLISFIRGFMYHYALDRTIHPYVFYNTGFPYTNKKYSYYHSKFESILDTLLSEKYDCKISTRKAIKTNLNSVKVCSKMLCAVLNEYFNIDLLKENTYYLAYKDFRMVRLVIDSKYGIKKWLLNLFLEKSTINAICQPRKVKDNDKYDYLNISNKEWINPCDGNTCNLSIEELFDIAKMECRIIDTIIHNYKDNIVTQRKITKYTNNINHDGRSLELYMTYFKIIWSNKKEE